MNAALGHGLFDTSLGPCGLAWGVAGIVAVQLPEPTPEATRQRLLRSSGPCKALAQADWPAMAVQAAQGVQALLQHGCDGGMLQAVALDMSAVPPFHRSVYALVRGIAPGQVRTYGDVAQALGSPGLARAVGQAMGANPFAPVVPCHRVLAAQQRPGGFSAAGGAVTKLRMLAIEGYYPGGTAPLF